MNAQRLVENTNIRVCLGTKGALKFRDRPPESQNDQGIGRGSVSLGEYKPLSSSPGRDLPSPLSLSALSDVVLPSTLKVGGFVANKKSRGQRFRLYIPAALSAR